MHNVFTEWIKERNFMKGTKLKYADFDFIDLHTYLLINYTQEMHAHKNETDPLY